jgi:hypothetical protein
MIISNRGRRGSRGGLGLVSTMVNGSMVLGSSPVARVAPFRPIGPAPFRPIISPVSTPPVSVGPTTNPAQWGGIPPRRIAPITSVNSQGSGSSTWGGRGVARTGRSQYGPQGSSSNTSQYGGLTYQQLQQIASTNPGVLTPQQYQAAQQAGFIAGTVPYSEASQIDPSAALAASAAGYSITNPDPQCIALGMTGGPYPNCTAVATTSSSDIGSALSEDIAGLPLYLWLLIAGGGYLLISKRGR